MLKTRQAQIPELQTRAAFAPDTLDDKARTIEVVWSTGARVLRQSWFDGPWWEELSLRSEHVDLSRLNAGAPVLNTHGRSTLEDIYGVVERAWIVNEKEGRAKLRFSEREDVEPYWRDVKSGVIRNISVGYSLRKLVKVEEVDEVPVMRAEDWQPFEISLVPVGADAGAGVRSKDETYPCTFIIPNSEARTVANQQPENHTEPKEIEKESAKKIEAARAEAIAAERQRMTEISSLCRTHKVGDEFAERQIASGANIDAVRAAILAELAERDSKTTTRSAHTTTITRDETETRRAAVENALLARFDAKRFPLSDAGRQYRSLSLLEIARKLVASRGEAADTMSKHQVAERALHTTSDFPYILAAVANKTLRTAYEAAPQTFRPFVRVTELPDFKKVARMQMGDAPDLERVNEHGEYKRGTLGEGTEEYNLATYGKIVGVTRQVIIDDDVGAFTRIPEMMARKAADLESNLVWKQITANLPMADGVAVFHANHGNIVTPGAPISIESLGAARGKLRLQTGLAGGQLNLQAQFLIVPTSLETVAEQFVSQIAAAEAGKINPFAGKLQIITDPRLDAVSTTAWYLAASPAQVDTIELAYLQGENGPMTETRQGFDIDGVEFKVRLDVAAKIIDHRWIVRNAGV